MQESRTLPLHPLSVLSEDTHFPSSQSTFYDTNWHEEEDLEYYGVLFSFLCAGPGERGWLSGRKAGSKDETV